MGVYDVMGAKFLDKKGLKIKKCTKNAPNLVCKIHKICQFFQKTCFNGTYYVYKLFCIKLDFLKYSIIFLCSIIADRADFHNFGLFIVWSANYGNFGYVDRTYFDPSIPFREWEVIIDQKNASNLTAPDMHTTPLLTPAY